MESDHKEILELFIITYNRSVYLNNTLCQLIDCPFAVFPITILDNCSTDNTYDVFLAYKNKFPNLNYVKNKINIGADANVLRAAEISNGVYTWILCDDDKYNFTFCDDILSELCNGEVAAIMVGWSNQFIWPLEKLYDTPENLMKKGFPYFSVPTFVPGSIFRTDLFQNQIRTSYANIINLLPVLTYYINLYDKNKLIYVSKHKIVSAMGEGGYHYLFLKVMIAVMDTFYLIRSTSVRRQAFYDSYLRPTYVNLVKYTLLMRKSEVKIPRFTKFRFFRILDWKCKILFLVIYCLAPILNMITLPTSVLGRLKKYKF